MAFPHVIFELLTECLACASTTQKYLFLVYLFDWRSNFQILARAAMAGLIFDNFYTLSEKFKRPSLTDPSNLYLKGSGLQ